ncbi:hypothetical protein CO174_02265 [Candidatus Uhrbacteria bacterium CG_4_9_14_3_um_filter_50_9]|uniref:Sporulation stage II protein D amidase enhancer LytB N-terminal domain-containing protein n=1 Tax=Candidatus Uhrbacteria bacterium CG_4_9_14_3_um_filter_50_9 TaxID=1975035 RepID=A0A2M7XCI3_9BACT|nr:MAG: hypothetical protein CO174_02265 [Candidatus Uhrbacteria bacterium CG_4_9_14_3_um_filter_50_9]
MLELQIMNFLSRDTHASRGKTAHWKLVSVSLFLALAGLFLFTGSASAASLKGFEALQVSAPKQGFTIAPGSTEEVTVEFQNTGEKTWVSSGSSYVSVYTYDPKYRHSDFEATDWSDWTQAATLDGGSVAPGSIGRITLTLTAPTKEGQYEETFHLAAEDTAWIPGGEFTLVINVSDEAVTPVATTPAQDEDVSTTQTEGLSAMLLLRSSKNVVAAGGEEVTYTVGIKNTGTIAWGSRGIVTSDLAVASTDTSHVSWVSSTQLVMNDSGTVNPGGLEFFKFTFTAPSSKGAHTVRYYLSANETVIPDFYIDIPVEVTSGAKDVIDDPITIDDDAASGHNVIDEPLLRVAVLIVDEETDWQVEISCDSDWRIKDSEGGLLGVMEAGEMVRAFYKNQRYYFNRGSALEETYKHLLFLPEDEDAICTIENFDQRETRSASRAYNRYHGSLELRNNTIDDNTYVINELRMSDYLSGLAETSDYSHQEFKKALIVAARTYAMYNFERAKGGESSTKHGGKGFHIVGWPDDQYYQGYDYEVQHPSIRDAVEDTYGVTVNWFDPEDGDYRTAITPYFSRSDGRTRSFAEVWYNEVDWLQSVDAPCDAERGYTLWGHGVGMSATEALCMADEGETWDDILHYFYTDIELFQRWE